MPPGQANLLRSAAHSLDVRGEASHYWYGRDSESFFPNDWLGFYSGNAYYWGGGYGSYRVWYFDADIKDRITINEFLSVTTGARFQYIDDTSRGITRGVDIETGLQYTRGALTVELNLEYDVLSVIESRSNGFGIFLNVKRNLSGEIPPTLRAGGTP
jgi:hypothetical protein